MANLIPFSPTNDDFGVTAIDGVPMVSSRQVAEVFNRRHDNVLQAVANCGCSPEFTHLNFKESTYKDKTGRKLPEILMTRDGFTFIAMGFTGKKAAQFKEAYIRRFSEMEQFIQSRELARLEYPDLTNMIASMHETPKFYHFSNEADMINRIVLGMTSKQFRERNGLRSTDAIRDYLSPRDIELIQRLQKFDVGLVVTTPDFQQRKTVLQAYFDKIKDRLRIDQGKGQPRWMIR